MGLGMLTGTLNVFFRDIGKSIGILLTFWFWTTPIVYPLVILPERMQEIVQTWNPIAGLMEFYHAILLSQPLPAVSSLYGFMILVLIVLPVWATSRIAKKAGFSPYWSIVVVLPFANVVLFWVFAFVEWPNVQRPSMKQRADRRLAVRAEVGMIKPAD